eukprot:TRINITY_DN23500_c0_g1_i3.p1 TRINITY_DN23500_c0_g1~~TRINITY_DN23500_c0_g1_i3.p1  ORF type:complete len:191 (+),score=22.32 TRINITY_DN23500_c0_g1_i3:137-709(+)
MQRGLVGSEMCIRDRYQRRVHGIPYILNENISLRHCTGWSNSVYYLNLFSYGIYFLLIWTATVLALLFLMFFLNRMIKYSYARMIAEICIESERIQSPFPFLAEPLIGEEDQGALTDKELREVIESFKPKKPSEKGELRCTICLEQSDPKTYYAIKKCQHVFHYNCLRLWTKHQPICPNCRSPLLEDQNQ